MGKIFSWCKSTSLGFYQSVPAEDLIFCTSEGLIQGLFSSDLEFPMAQLHYKASLLALLAGMM